MSNNKVVNDLKNEIKNRLNLDIDSLDELNSKKYLTFNILKSKCIKKTEELNLIIPTLLISDIKNIIEESFKNLTEKQKDTKLNQFLFIPLILFNNIYKKKNEDRDLLLYEYGYQLSKELLTSVMSPNDLYKAKNILLEKEIIKEAKWTDGFYYSIYDKKAIKYVLNSKYKKLECKFVENKYVEKLNILLKNKLAIR